MSAQVRPRAVNRSVAKILVRASNSLKTTSRVRTSTRLRPGVDGFGLAALAASGTLAAHQMAYLVDAEARNAHAYFVVVGPVVLLAAFAATWLAAIRIIRRDVGRLPSVGALTAYQVGLYVAIEIGERIVGGEALGSLTSTPVVLGLAAQPVVAWAALRLLRVGARLIIALVAPPVSCDRPSSLSWTVSPRTVLQSFPHATIRLRGPPG